MHPEPLAAQPRPSRGSRPRVEGKFLAVKGRRFWVRGVTYGTFLPNSRGELFPEADQVEADFEQMARAGVNTVRTYTAPPRWLMDLAHSQGLMVVAGLFWEGRECLFDDTHALDRVADGLRLEMEALAGHPALLLVCLGNEARRRWSLAGTAGRRSSGSCAGCGTS